MDKEKTTATDTAKTLGFPPDREILDFGLILLISNMIIHSFTGPTHILLANVRGPVSFVVSAARWDQKHLKCWDLCVLYKRFDSDYIPSFHEDTITDPYPHFNDGVVIRGHWIYFTLYLAVMTAPNHYPN